MSEVRSALSDIYSGFYNLSKSIISNIYQKYRKYPYVALSLVGALILSVSAYALLKEDIYTKEELIDVLKNEVFKTCNGRMNNINDDFVNMNRILPSVNIPKKELNGYIALIDLSNCYLNERVKN